MELENIVIVKKEFLSAEEAIGLLKRCSEDIPFEIKSVKITKGGGLWN